MSILGNAKLCRAALAVGIVALAASDALAWGHKGYGSYGSYGGYGSYGSYGVSYASYGSYGSYGSYDSCGSSGGGGLFARWHAKKAARYSSYGSYGGYDSCGSSGGYAVAYGSYGSYGSYASCGSSGGVVYDGGGVYDSGALQSAPTNQPPTPPTPPGGAPTPQPDMNNPGAGGVAPPATGNPTTRVDEATIWVSLPVDAKVFVNDVATKSTGAERHYVSRGLEPGRTYSYKLRVEFNRDGKPLVEDKLVRLQAGNSVQLAFGNGQSAEEETAKTELKLHVPEQAKVTLAGAATKQTGEVRSYSTSGLNPGQHWDGYTVRVELEKDGKTLSEEKTLDIEGGKTYELSFEMSGDSLKVASAN
jgi:uncharacterized protein (TIGR03000 family)